MNLLKIEYKIKALKSTIDTNTTEGKRNVYWKY